MDLTRRAKIQAKYYLKHKKRIRQTQQEWHRKNKAYVRSKHLAKLGLSITSWNRLFKMQRGLCPICLEKLRRPKVGYHRQAATVDHDHVTGRVRGLVCPTCNRTRIGPNTVATARRLLRYLQSEFDGRKEVQPWMQVT